MEINERVLKSDNLPVVAAILAGAVISKISIHSRMHADKTAAEEAVDVYKEISTLLSKLHP